MRFCCAYDAKHFKMDYVACEAVEAIDTMHTKNNLKGRK